MTSLQGHRPTKLKEMTIVPKNITKEVEKEGKIEGQWIEENKQKKYERKVRERTKENKKKGGKHRARRCTTFPAERIFISSARSII